MKIGIVVLCRLSSSRLPEKALMQMRGRAVLGHILARLARAAPEIPVVVATSNDSSDDALERYCSHWDIPCFRGSLDDVAGRFIECATSHGWDYAVRINGDNLLIDGTTLREMLAIAGTGCFDFVTNVPGRTFPTGMSVEIVRTSFYREAMAATTAAHHREHVTLYLYETPDLGRRHVHLNTRYPEAAGLHLALDTAEDFERTAAIMTRAGARADTIGLGEILDILAAQGQTTPWRGESGPLLIAEIGGNHEGDFEAAKALTEKAVRSGADCVKFQIYSGDGLVSPVESPVRHKHFQRFELRPEQHIELARMCRDAGVTYCASVWDLESLDWIDPYLAFYKIGSGDLTDWPLVAEFARRGKPIAVSTGLATLDEVAQTVRHIEKVDARYRRPEWLCVLQCTSMYPIPDCDANLAVMDAFREELGVAVGYSDHTIGTVALHAAAAMGAQVLEFHFTDSREGKAFRDHKVSLTESEVRQLKADIARLTELRGDGVKVPQESELNEKHEVSFRRAVYVRRPIAAGQTIAADDLVYLRPAHGTDARDAKRVIGATAARDLEPYKALLPGEDYLPDAAARA